MSLMSYIRKTIRQFWALYLLILLMEFNIRKMGLFGNLFRKNGKEKKEGKTLPWIILASMDQLNEIEQKSMVKPQLIFKHSTTCGISSMVLNRFTGDFTLEKDQIDLYFLDLRSYREVSNEVGHKFQVMHQSPQLLVIKDGAVVAHGSHGAISNIDLLDFI